MILRDDRETTAGDTYELDVYHRSASGADMGFLFGVQAGGAGWSEFTGYMGLFESDDDQIAIQRWESGSLADEAVTAVTWPLDEWLTVELDYRDSDSGAIEMTVFDSSGAEVASVSFADTTYDSGIMGWNNWHASADWFADSWLEV